MPKSTFDIGVLAAADLGVVALFDGAAVYTRGDKADWAYVVRSGAVELRCLDRTVEVLGPGEMFGVADLLDGGARYCSARSVGATELIPLSRSLVEALLNDDPEFASALAALMVRRLRAAYAMLEPSDAMPAIATGLEQASADFETVGPRMGR